jgi:hypothetical protein
LLPGDPSTVNDVPTVCQLTLACLTIWSIENHRSSIGVIQSYILDASEKTSDIISLREQDQDLFDSPVCSD